MTAPLKIAVLLDGLASRNTAAIQASFETAITSASSLKSNAAPPRIDFYDPIIAQIHPDPIQYDLIVLSGGTADPMGSDPWVLKLQHYLRTTVQDFSKQKIVGICWGHQTTCVSFGGSVGSMDGPAEIGVTQITLTEEGKRMFPFASDGTLQIHEFHAREIKTPGKGFVPLAEGNQMFVNVENTILTFQGHPEFNAELARTLLANTPAYMGLDRERKEALVEEAEMDHDGVKIWARILEWVRE